MHVKSFSKQAFLISARESTLLKQGEVNLYLRKKIALCNLKESKTL